jgi:hypothetical protein
MLNTFLQGLKKEKVFGEPSDFEQYGVVFE